MEIVEKRDAATLITNVQIYDHLSASQSQPSSRSCWPITKLLSKRIENNLLNYQKVVRPGSIIHSDEWRAHRSIQVYGYAHETVNHSVINFVNRMADIHTQTIESYWNKHKYMIKKMKGCRKDLLHSYLFEMMWRDRFGTNSFEKNMWSHCSLLSFLM